MTSACVVVQGGSAVATSGGGGLAAELPALKQLKKVRHHGRANTCVPPVPVVVGLHVTRRMAHVAFSLRWCEIDVFEWSPDRD